MLSSCLLSGLIIGSISTLVYALITDKKNKEQDLINRDIMDRKMDFLVIFSVIMVVSVIILYFTNKNNTGQVVPLKGGFSPKVNNQPPF